MIKHVFDNFRSLADALCAGLAFVNLRIRGRNLPDAWMFEDTLSTRKIACLPTYPSQQAMIQRDTERLDRIGYAITQIAQDLARLRSLTQSAQSLAECVEAGDSVNADRVTEFGYSHTPSKRLGDPVVTEVLFGCSLNQHELDSELFELSDSDDVVQMLPAYQVSRSFGPVDAELHYSSRSGG